MHNLVLAVCLLTANPAASHLSLDALLELDIGGSPVATGQLIEDCSFYLRKSSDLKPGARAKLLLLRAAAYLERHKWHDSLVDLSEIRRLKQETVLAKLYRLDALFGLRRDRQLMAEAKELRRLAPNNPGVYLRLAQCALFGARDRRACLKYCNQGIALTKDDPRLYFLRATANFELGGWKQVLEDVNRYLELGTGKGGGSQAALPYFYRAYVRLAVYGEFKFVLRDLRIAERHTPDPLSIKALLWYYYCKQGKFHAAQEITAQMREMDRKAEGWYFYAGMLALRHGRTHEAEQILKTAQVDRPTSFSAHMGACIKMANKNYRHAISDVDRCLKLDQNSSAGAMLKAFLLATCPEQKYRDGGLAVKLAKKWCVHSDNKNHRYLMVWAMACAECGQFDRATELANKAIRLLEKRGRENHLKVEYQRCRRLFQNKQKYRYRDIQFCLDLVAF